MDKRVRHYNLSEIKLVFSRSEELGITNRMTVSSRDGARALGFSDEDIIAVIQSLTRSDFYKSMTSKNNHSIWQDVYKPSYKGIDLYVKFTRDEQNGFYLLISFKEM